MLQWKDEFLVGIDMVDEQHRKLIDIANQACILAENELIVDKYDQIAALINELREYTIYHFKAEEELMAQIGYKKRFSHMVKHGDFIAQVNAVNFKEFEENQNEYINRIINFVCDWLINHIMQEDKLIKAG